MQFSYTYVGLNELQLIMHLHLDAKLCRTPHIKTSFLNCIHYWQSMQVPRNGCSVALLSNAAFCTNSSFQVLSKTALYWVHWSDLNSEQKKNYTFLPLLVGVQLMHQPETAKGLPGYLFIFLDSRCHDCKNYTPTSSGHCYLSNR